MQAPDFILTPANSPNYLTFHLCCLFSISQQCSHHERSLGRLQELLSACRIKLFISLCGPSGKLWTCLHHSQHCHVPETLISEKISEASSGRRWDVIESRDVTRSQSTSLLSDGLAWFSSSQSTEGHSAQEKHKSQIGYVPIYQEIWEEGIEEPHIPHSFYKWKKLGFRFQ